MRCGRPGAQHGRYMVRKTGKPDQASGPAYLRRRSPNCVGGHAMQSEEQCTRADAVLEQWRNGIGACETYLNTSAMQGAALQVRGASPQRRCAKVGGFMHQRALSARRGAFLSATALAGAISAAAVTAGSACNSRRPAPRSPIPAWLREGMAARADSASTAATAATAATAGAACNSQRPAPRSPIPAWSREGMAAWADRASATAPSAATAVTAGSACNSWRPAPRSPIPVRSREGMAAWADPPASMAPRVPAVPVSSAAGSPSSTAGASRAAFPATG